MKTKKELAKELAEIMTNNWIKAGDIKREDFNKNFVFNYKNNMNLLNKPMMETMLKNITRL